MKHPKNCRLEGCRRCARSEAAFDRVVKQLETINVRTAADRRRQRRLCGEMQWRADRWTPKQRRRHLRLEKARRRRGWDERRIWNRSRPLLERDAVTWRGVDSQLKPSGCLHVDGCGGFEDPKFCQRDLPF